MTNGHPLPRALIRMAVTAFQRVRRTLWFPTRPTTHGVHAVALTPTGDILLVRLTYASGWRLPGGGRRAGEAPQAAVLRELREEVGMFEHGEVRHVRDLPYAPDFRRGVGALFVVSDVRHRPPRWSLEIDEVGAFAPDRLPPDMARIARKQIADARASLDDALRSAVDSGGSAHRPDNR